MSLPFKALRRSQVNSTSTLVSLLAVIDLLTGTLAGVSQTTLVHGIFQGQEFMQAGTYQFPARPAYWECWSRGFGPGDLSDAVVSTPKPEAISLDLDDEGAFLVEDFASTVQRTLQFPSGSYSLRLTKADQSELTVPMTQATAVYPAAPKLIGDILQMQVPAGANFDLQWELPTDARTDDFYRVAVNGMTNWVLSTAWPGQPGALSGLATNVALPGAKLKEDDILTIHISRYRVASKQTLSNGQGTSLAGSVSGTYVTVYVVAGTETPLTDVASYQVGCGRISTQTGDAPPTLLPANAFQFEALATAVADAALTNVTLRTPSGALRQLSQPTAATWLLRSNYSAESSLRQGFPAGNYAWAFGGTNTGEQRATNTVVAGTWPDTLKVNNWPWLQTNSFTNAWVLSWASPAGAAAADRIEFSVATPSGAILYRQPDYQAGDSVIGGTATQMTIPADVLNDGEEYEGRLRYLKMDQLDTQTITDATGISCRYAETRFALGSKVAMPMTITSTNLPDARLAAQYTGPIYSTGGRRPVVWSLLSGSVPRGLGLAEEGRVVGIAAETGTFTFWVKALDALGNAATQRLSLSVTGAIAPLAILTSNLPPVTDGIYYSTELGSGGGIRPFKWSIGGGQLPRGITLNGTAGLISGIAQESGFFPIQLLLEDGAGTTRQAQLTLSVPSSTNSSVLRFLEASPIPGGKLRCRLNTEPDELCTFEVSSNLVHWQEFTYTNVPQSGVVDLGLADGAPRFFRAMRGRPGVTPNPLNAAVVADTNNTVSGVLTRSNGLSLTLTAPSGEIWTLSIPANAVREDTTIKMSRVQTIDSDLLRSAMRSAVSLEPDGLILLRSGTLTLQLPAGSASGLAGVGYDGGGRGFYLHPILHGNNSLVFPVAHFSGYGGVRESDDLYDTLSNSPDCRSGNRSFNQAARILSQESTVSPEMKWLVIKGLYWEAISPELKAAESEESLLDRATVDCLAWEALVTTYLQIDLFGAEPSDSLEQEAWRLARKGLYGLARAYASAVNKAHEKCVTQYRPWQMTRMVYVAGIAWGLGLDSVMPGFFEEAKITDRFKRAFRFELLLTARLDVFANGGGYFGASVVSERGPFIPTTISTSDFESGSAKLCSTFWRMKSDGEITPYIEAGNLGTVRLALTPTYPDNSVSECLDFTKYSLDPEEVKIECAFDATDPIQKMLVKTKEGWKEMPARNWWDTFKLAHPFELKDVKDSTGQTRKCVDLFPERWEYMGWGPLIAKITYAGIPDIAQGVSEGVVMEDTWAELYHAPKPLRAEDSSIPGE
jgi:hypothetical protein